MTVTDRNDFSQINQEKIFKAIEKELKQQDLNIKRLMDTLEKENEIKQTYIREIFLNKNFEKKMFSLKLYEQKRKALYTSITALSLFLVLGTLLVGFFYAHASILTYIAGGFALIGNLITGYMLSKERKQIRNLFSETK